MCCGVALVASPLSALPRRYVCVCLHKRLNLFLHILQKRHAYICSVNMMALIASQHSARPRRYVFGSLCISMPVSFGHVKETYRCIQSVLWDVVGSKSTLRTPAQVCMCVPTQERCMCVPT